MSGKLVIIDGTKTDFRFIEKGEYRTRDCEIINIKDKKRYLGTIFSISSSGKYVVEITEELND